MSSRTLTKAKLPPFPRTTPSPHSVTRTALSTSRRPRHLATATHQSPSPFTVNQPLHPAANNVDKPSPIKQACYKLPQNRAWSTFLYHKLPSSQVPPNWSNNPTDLEIALSTHAKIQSQCPSVPGFLAPMPVLVMLHAMVAPGHQAVKQYLFEAAEKYYVYDGATGVICQITRPSDLEGILGELKEKGALDMVVLNVLERK